MSGTPKYRVVISFYRDGVLLFEVVANEQRIALEKIKEHWEVFVRKDTNTKNTAKIRLEAARRDGSDHHWAYPEQQISVQNIDDISGYKPDDLISLAEFVYGKRKNK